MINCLALCLHLIDAQPLSPVPSPAQPSIPSDSIMKTKVAILIDTLRKGSPAERLRAKKSLEELGVAALPALDAYRNDLDPEIVTWVHEQLKAGIVWAKCLKLGDKYTDGQKIELMFIPRGSFIMGSPEDEKGRKENGEAQHEVTLPRALLMGCNVVTQAQWQAVMGSNPSRFKDQADSSLRPVENVNWHDCQEFCKKITMQERQAARLPEGWIYRLPTEAEWEYACRAGTSGRLYGELDAIAWHARNSGENTQPVGEKQANAWGLHDMMGNVSQWCEDGFKRSMYSGSSQPIAAPQSPYRCIRGAGYDLVPEHFRMAWRGGHVLEERNQRLGFRVVIAAPQPEENLEKGIP
jgi:formylglycine-generating enzyme required for sulfatase activity